MQDGDDCENWTAVNYNIKMLYLILLQVQNRLWSLIINMVTDAQLL